VITFRGFGSDYDLSSDALWADGFVSHCWAPPENWAEVIGEAVAEVIGDEVVIFPGTSRMVVNTLWLFNIAMGNDPLIDGLPINSMVIFHGYVK
jgi:hypothetical protein